MATLLFFSGARSLMRSSADLKLVLHRTPTLLRLSSSTGFKEGATTITRSILNTSKNVPRVSRQLQLLRPLGRLVTSNTATKTSLLQAVRQSVILRTMTQSSGGGLGNEWTALSKMSMGQRLSVMFKKYWYIALPLHFVGSCAWFGGLYLLCRLGVDGARLIAWIQPYVAQSTIIPDFVKELFKKDPASLGHLAVAALLYKLVTPLRYMTTIFGTFYVVKYLLRSGKMKNIQKRKLIKKFGGSFPKSKPPPPSSKPPPSS